MAKILCTDTRWLQWVCWIFVEKCLKCGLISVKLCTRLNFTKWRRIERFCVIAGALLGVAAVDFVLQLVSLGLSLSPRPLSRGQFLGDGDWRSQSKVRTVNMAHNGAANSDRRQQENRRSLKAVSNSGFSIFGRLGPALLVEQRPASLLCNRTWAHFLVESAWKWRFYSIKVINT